MLAVRRPRARFLAAGATAGVAVATALGLLMPTGAQAATTYTTKPDAVFICVNTCTAGGIGWTTGVARPEKTGRWSRKFTAECKWDDRATNTRKLRGRVTDTHWSGVWDVASSGLINSNDWPVRWC